MTGPCCIFCTSGPYTLAAPHSFAESITVRSSRILAYMPEALSTIPSTERWGSSGEWGGQKEKKRFCVPRAVDCKPIRMRRRVTHSLKTSQPLAEVMGTWLDLLLVAVFLIRISQPLSKLRSFRRNHKISLSGTSGTIKCPGRTGSTVSGWPSRVQQNK